MLNFELFLGSLSFFLFLIIFFHASAVSPTYFAIAHRMSLRTALENVQTLQN